MPITDLVVKGNDVVIATQGRSFWVLDDVTPLRGLSAEVMAADAHLFKPSAAFRMGGGGGFGEGGGGRGGFPPKAGGSRRKRRQKRIL